MATGMHNERAVKHAISCARDDALRSIADPNDWFTMGCAIGALDILIMLGIGDMAELNKLRERVNAVRFTAEER